MPKACINGSGCAHLKTLKGCKFLHTELETRNALAHVIYSEVVSALNQAHCTTECHEKNISGRMTGMLLEAYDEAELRSFLKKPSDFAEKMVNALEILEMHDMTIYVPTAGLML